MTRVIYCFWATTSFLENSMWPWILNFCYWKPTLESRFVLMSWFSPAVSLGDFFNGQSDLVAEVSSRVNDSKCAFSQNHPLSVLIVLIVVLWRQERVKCWFNFTSEKETLEISNTYQIIFNEHLIAGKQEFENVSYYKTYRDNTINRSYLQSELSSLFFF